MRVFTASSARMTRDIAPSSTTVSACPFGYALTSLVWPLILSNTCFASSKARCWVSGISFSFLSVALRTHLASVSAVLSSRPSRARRREISLLRPDASRATSSERSSIASRSLPDVFRSSLRRDETLENCNESVASVAACRVLSAPRAF